MAGSAWKRSTASRDLGGFGAFSRAELAAAGALVDYVELTQQGKLPALLPRRAFRPGDVMEIDAATRRNLELTESLTGERNGSLLAAIDRTETGAGARLLAEHLAAPLTDPRQRSRRGSMRSPSSPATSGLRERLRDELRQCADMARAMARLGLGRGGPRDLAALRDTLRVSASLRALLREAEFAAPPPLIASLERDLGEHQRAGRPPDARACGRNCRCSRAMAASSRRATSAELDEL